MKFQETYLTAIYYHDNTETIRIESHEFGHFWSSENAAGRADYIL